ncbi:Acetyltransferase [Sphingomonas antarctica]|uniref:acetyltransferase n=1 Tax=Sphingomonas antarctica TaxID=2040274 RepID=UPI0039EC0AEE
MAINRIILIGAGGHARVVFDALIAGGTLPDTVTVRDARGGGEVLMHRAVAPEIDETIDGSLFHVAIGNAQARARLSAAAGLNGGRALTIVHPRATVSPYAVLGLGVFVAAGAIVGPGATIGDGAIVNHNAVVDHDCAVGDFAHIAPHATLGGGAMVGTLTLVGAGGVVLPGVTVGPATIIGAGSVVTRDVSGGQWVGSPARNMESEQ